jgi:diguanylate cyclase (GGDEF)-like protein
VFPHDDSRVFPTGQLRLLLALNMQVGLTLDNYILMHEAKRRTKEYELLTQIGQVISSRLVADEVLREVQRELGRLFDTGTFFVAFQDGENLRFEFETVRGVVQPKRTRKFGGGFSDHIIHNGQPLLIQSGLDRVRDELGISERTREMKSFVGVPLRMGGRTAGVMGVINADREFAFDQRDLDVLLTAAGQVAVAMENALLFADAQVRAKDLTFLNHISARAISSQNAEEMLPEIVQEIQRNFAFEHIGIGFLDYGTKDIEIKAEAGTTSKMAGKRVPLGVGILGRVARSGEFALVQGSPEPQLPGIIPDSRSVLCVPLAYGETLLGVLNIESTREHAFSAQDVLLLRTLADLLSTALHNAFIFQKMQQQSITDGLTGIKTRRFFLEALSQEWKRASRSGRPFSVVLVDLDKFKDVNDTMGHLEGDLVLARVGRLLEQKCRQSNVVARYGGDEFVILMPETGVEQALILSERLRLWMATDPMLNERRVTGSFGVASFPLHGASTEDIIRVADVGMYVSKHAGGNRVSTAEEVTEAETSSMHRQQITAYVEGFLQREHSGPEHIAELVSTLRRMCDSLGEPAGTDAMMEAIRSLNQAVEVRERSSSTHGSGVAFYSRMIGQELGMTPEELEDLVFAASVHDVGKVAVPERLLTKPGRLDDEEFSLVKMHATIGAQIFDAIHESKRLRNYVRHHHERFDGLGYPDALKGEEIPLGARIIAVADAFVNMTTDRPFASAKAPADAVQELESLSGLQFDGMIVRILTAHLKGERMTAGRQ